MEPTKPLLSICIPTYNRAPFLDKALEDLTSQITPEVEIVISDDGSKDETETIAQKWQIKFPTQIIYYKKPQNERFDKNLITVIEKAHGKYCWFMSDDDMLNSGAVVRVLEEIKKKEQTGSLAFLLLNYSRYDNDKKEITMERMMEFEDQTFTLDAFMGTRSPNSFFDFLGKNIIYMSVFIFPREYWLSYVENCRKYIGVNFIHCFVFVHMLVKEKLPITYIGKSYVLYRSGNIRAWGNNIWKDFHKKFLGEAQAVGISGKVIREIRYAYFSNNIKIKCKALLRRIWK